MDDINLLLSLKNIRFNLTPEIKNYFLNNTSINDCKFLIDNLITPYGIILLGHQCYIKKDILYEKLYFYDPISNKFFMIHDFIRNDYDLINKQTLKLLKSSIPASKKINIDLLNKLEKNIKDINSSKNDTNIHNISSYYKSNNVNNCELIKYSNCKSIFPPLIDYEFINNIILTRQKFDCNFNISYYTNDDSECRFPIKLKVDNKNLYYSILFKPK